MAYTEINSDRGPSIAPSKREKKDNTHWLYIAVIIAVIGGIVLGLVAGYCKSTKAIG